MNKNEQWLKWAVELQAIAQGGLFYGKDKFDIERYERRKCQVFLQHFFKKIFNIVYLLFIIYNDII